jgi:hypothetical protein
VVRTPTSTSAHDPEDAAEQERDTHPQCVTSASDRFDVNNAPSPVASNDPLMTVTALAP